MYFFVWIGGGFAGGSLKLGEWSTRRAIKVLTPSVCRWFFVALLVAAIPLQAAVGYTEWSWLQQWLQPYRWGWDAVQKSSFMFANQWHCIVSIVVLAMFVIGWIRRGPGRWMAWLACWWITLFLMCLALWKSNESMVDQHGKAGENLFIGFSGFAVLLGLIWEGGRLRRSPRAAPEQRWKELAWLAALLSLTICLQSLKNNKFITAQLLALSQGMFYLALLRLGYAWVSKAKSNASVLTKPMEIGCFVIGIIGICPLVYWHPWDAWCLPWFIPAIIVAIAILRQIRPVLDATALAYAGGLMAVGAVYQCYGRAFPELPVNPWVPYESYKNAQTVAVGHQMEPFTIQHVLILGGMIAAGLLAGWAISRWVPARKASNT
jgi:hypothetical protein